MNTWDGIWLGLVQGLTEFLPVSSSGHLVLAEKMLGVSTPGVLVEVILHVATLLAITVVYRRRLMSLLKGLVMGDRQSWAYSGLIVLATIPAVIVGLALKPLVEDAFDSTLFVGLNLIITAGILFSTRLTPPGRIVVPGRLGSLGIGLAQAFAILPGISRSGSTVAAAMWMGVDAVKAAEFSFIMAIPAIMGAMVLQLPELGPGLTGGVGPGALAAGFLTALASGIFAIRLLIVLLRKAAFHKFAPYLLLVGSATVIYRLAG